MKKIVILLLCLALITLGACKPEYVLEVVTVSTDPMELPIPTEELDVGIEPLPTDSPTITEAPAVPDPPPMPDPALPSPTAQTGPNMYDSNALFVSFDPSTGIAAFDFIDVLQGDDAVQHMVNYEGKTPQEAQDIVDGWADSECIIKNHNPQLRMIDMDGPAITMLWYPNGAEDFTLNGVSFSYQDFVTLYTNHPDKVDWYLFYHIDVDGAGNVVEVEQVYWP